MRPTLLAAALLVSATCLAQEQPQTDARIAAADPAEVQLAVEKGLFYVEQQSMRWWKAERCATCHEGGILLVAANVAKAQGVPVNQEKLDLWTDQWVLLDGVTRKKKNGELAGLGMWTAPLMYLYRDSAREESASRAGLWTNVVRGSLASQGKDGLWPSGDIEVTPRMALALESLEKSAIPFPEDFRVELAESRIRAETWIKSHEPQRPEKTESLAAWIAYELERGEPARAKLLLDELRRRRNDDGGWGSSKEIRVTPWSPPSCCWPSSPAACRMRNLSWPASNVIFSSGRRRMEAGSPWAGISRKTWTRPPTTPGPQAMPSRR
jgi:hypothetical protein